MKKSILLTFALSVMVLLTQAQTVFTDATQYNNYIIGEQKAIGEKIVAFSESMSAENASKEQSVLKYNELLKGIDKAVENTNNLTTFKDKAGNGDFNLKKAALTLFKFYKEYVLVVFSIALEEVYKTTPDLTRYTEQNDIYTEKEKIVDGEFQSVQGKFAEFYKIKLE